ncbi:MAG: S-layer homology domain-containing protein [Chloroflexi bacterium]|nr:S-layer homology domain-containing protein [Chloroflexota bacterium]
MKQRSTIIILALSVTLVLTAFFVGKASATTGCFSDTNAHWAETFICWLKDNGISAGYADGTYHPDSGITRAEMAVMLQKTDELAVSQANSADATNLAAAKAYTDSSLSTGVTYIGAGNTAWQKNGSGTHYVEYWTDGAYLSATGAGTYGFQLTASLPDSLFNHLMYLNGVQICYDVNSSATLTSVYLQHWYGGAAPSIYKEVSDLTDRTDATCRTYSIALPGSLFGNNHVDVYVQVTFTGAADDVRMTSTTFILSPSTSPGFLSPLEDLGPIEDTGPAAGGYDGQ